MDSESGKIIYEVIFKVRSTRQQEFEGHCTDTVKYIENHPGFLHLNFNRRLNEDNSEFTHYRVEIAFENQDSLTAYQKEVVPVIRANSPQFGDDAKVEDRRIYQTFFSKCKKH